MNTDNNQNNNQDNNQNINNFDLFLHNYELILKNIYITALHQHGKGILVIDINSNNNGNCDTQYISVNSNEEFWKDANNIKEKIIKNEDKKVYFYLIDNKSSVILERAYA